MRFGHWNGEHGAVLTLGKDVSANEPLPADFPPEQPHRGFATFLPGRDGHVRAIRTRINEEEGTALLGAEPQPASPSVLHRKTSKFLFQESSAGMHWIHGQNFERMMGFLVVLNALLLGWEASYAAVTQGEDFPWMCQVADVVFCLIFAVEWVLRVHASGAEFFKNENRGWNILDTLLVGMQVSEHLVQALNVIGWFGTLRILRLIRIVRLVRVLHLFDELQAIVTAMSGCWKSLLWVILLMLLMVYMFSVFFLHSIAHAGVSLQQGDLQHWFGSLGRTMMTMFECIAGGVSWDEVATPLMTTVSPFMGLLFCGYICVGCFAMLNLVTGIFVENVIKNAKEDRDSMMAIRIGHLFVEGGDVNREITRESFAKKMESKEVQDYLKDIDLRPSEAPRLFELLDVDSSGSVDSDEIVTGCLGLRGSAKGLDVCVLLREINAIQDTMNALVRQMDDLPASLERLPVSQDKTSRALSRIPLPKTPLSP